MDDLLGKNSLKNEIIWCYEKPRIARNKLKENHDNILFYAKYPEDSIFNVQYIPKKEENGRHVTNYGGKVLGDWWDIASFSTIMSAKERTYFSTQKPESLLRRIMECSMVARERDIVLDFFVGSGATLAVANKLGKKWIGIEMGEHCNTFYQEIMEIEATEDINSIEQEYKKYKVIEVISKSDKKYKIKVSKYGALGKMKMVLACEGNREPTKLSNDLGYNGGGFFKYYDLEQYEETLAMAKYTDGDLFQQNKKSLYEEYVFLADEKMLECIEIDYEKNKTKLDLTKLYDDIDIAETLSNLTGKWIKRISAEEVVFTDESKINIKDLDPQIIKPLIWWNAE